MFFTRPLFLSLCFALFLGFTAVPADADTREVGASCEIFLTIAVENVVRATFPDHTHYALQAYNDVMCEEPEDMANVAITVVVSKEEQFFAVEHLHYNHDGSVPEHVLAYFKDRKTWKRARIRHAWKDDWCKWMHYVYPEEKEKFKCEQFFYK